MDEKLFEIVPKIVKCLPGWRCDVRGARPRLLGPEGAYVTSRMEQGNRIHFYAAPPTGPDGYHRSWQTWGVPLEQWSRYSITCSAGRAPEQIARDLSRRLLLNIIRYWPQVMVRKREELAGLETVRHVTDLFLKVLDGACVVTWNSSVHRKNIRFDGGNCVVEYFGNKASLSFNDLSFDDALKLAAFYQQTRVEQSEKSSVSG